MLEKINPITKKERYIEMDTLKSDNKFLRFNPISKQYYILKYKIINDVENDKNNKNLNL